MDHSIRTVLAELVQSEGADFYGDASRVESLLRERAGEHGDEIVVLVAALRAGVVHEVREVNPGLLEIAVGHVAARMVRLFAVDPDAAHWAAESWAQALRAEPAAEPPPPPSVLAVETGPTDPYPPPEREERRPGVSIPWPWVAGVGAGVVGLVALVVLLRLISGLVSDTSGTGKTARTKTATSAPPSTTVPTPVSLVVPPDLSLGTGDVQVTLLWADGNDLDLHVIDPSGAEIYFSNPTSPTGGTLDHDDTAGCSSTGTHVENVFWPAGRAPSGRYRVFVKNYSSCGGASRYSLEAKVRGRMTISSRGSVGAQEGDETPPSEFSFS